MGSLDILQHYTNGAAGRDPQSANDDFDQVSGSVPPQMLGHGVADAFRSDSTPPFGDMVSNLFGRSDPQQRAGLVNQLLGTLGPSLLASLGGGLLGRLSAPSPAQVPNVSPEQASKMTPEEIRDIAARAEQHDPTVMDRVGSYYAQHPQLVKTLGSAALAIAMAGLSNRMRRQ